MQISKDVKIDEGLAWNWEKQEAEVVPSPAEAHSDAEEVDDEEYLVDSEEYDYAPIRGTRTLQDVYLRCNVAVTEPTSSIEASSIAVWREAMLLELKLIERN